VQCVYNEEMAPGEGENAGEEWYYAGSIELSSSVQSRVCMKTP
jgi:hypothetical protein